MHQSLEATLRAAVDLGWAIIPSQDRKPLVKWRHIKPGNPPKWKDVQKWQERYNPDSWQIVLGRPSGLIVLDGDLPAGPATLEKLGLTPHVRSRSGGAHYYATIPTTEEVRTRSKATCAAAGFPDLEIKADGSLIHFAGRSGSGTYKWLRPLKAEEFSPALVILPADLQDLWKPPVYHAGQRYTTAAPPEPAARVDWEWLLSRAIRDAIQRGRNNTGAWLAAQLRDADYSQAESTQIVCGYFQPSMFAAATGKDPYTGAEAYATVKSIYSKAKRDPIIRGYHRTTAAPRPQPAPPKRQEPPAPQPAPADSDPPPWDGYGPDHVDPHDETDAFKQAIGDFIEQIRDQPEPEPEQPPPPEPPEAPAAAIDRDQPGHRKADTADYHLTDLGNAERVLHRNGNQIRYAPVMGHWFIWDKKRLERDETERVRSRAQQTARAIWAEIGRRSHMESDEKKKARVQHAQKSESSRSINAALAELAALPGVAIKGDQLDAQPWLFNCQNCTIDLRTGEARPHSREDLITKMSNVIYDPNAPAPAEWLKFLSLIMDGQQSMIEYLQTCIGYCLTGDISERALFVPWGNGANGKSTFLLTIHELMGEYGLKTPSETLAGRKPGSIPNDIARLRAARFVYASETEQGSKLNEGLVKELTGGEPLTARFLHAEFFTFTPECKYWLGTNHKPIISGTDQGIWDRIKLIPFTVRIPEVLPIGQQITREEALQRFRLELSGIFNWALAGLARYRAARRLPTPKEITDAVAAYRADMDVLGNFLEEYTRQSPHPQDSISATTLYKCYTAWAKENGETVNSQKVFGNLLSERGYIKKKSHGTQLYLHLRLIKNINESQSESGDDRGMISPEMLLEKSSHSLVRETPQEATIHPPIIPRPIKPLFSEPPPSNGGNGQNHPQKPTPAGSGSDNDEGEV